MNLIGEHKYTQAVVKAGSIQREYTGVRDHYIIRERATERYRTISVARPVAKGRDSRKRIQAGDRFRLNKNAQMSEMYDEFRYVEIPMVVPLLWII